MSITHPSPSTSQFTADLDLDFIEIQLRGTFEGRVGQMLALPVQDRKNQSHLTALDAINAALARLANGTYGCCESCEGPIAAARLEVVPTTTSCADCQRLAVANRTHA